MSSVARKSEGWTGGLEFFIITLIMFYVYLIRSLKYPEQTYIGFTTNIKQRLETHNSGGSVHTQVYRPWEWIVCMSFKNEKRAIEFEKYLKSGSGKAFAQKRLW